MESSRTVEACIWNVSIYTAIWSPVGCMFGPTRLGYHHIRLGAHPMHRPKIFFILIGNSKLLYTHYLVIKLIVSIDIGIFSLIRKEWSTFFSMRYIRKVPDRCCWTALNDSVWKVYCQFHRGMKPVSFFRSAKSLSVTPFDFSLPGIAVLSLFWRRHHRWNRWLWHYVNRDRRHSCILHKRRPSRTSNRDNGLHQGSSAVFHRLKDTADIEDGTFVVVHIRCLWNQRCRLALEEIVIVYKIDLHSGRLDRSYLNDQWMIGIFTIRFIPERRITSCSWLRRSLIYPNLAKNVLISRPRSWIPWGRLRHIRDISVSGR